MRIRNVLLAVVLAGSAGLGATACTSRAYLVEEAPPPPRNEVVSSRPGHVFVKGHWARKGGHWSWVEGRFERERSGYVYVDGHWDRRPQGYVWIEGAWRHDNDRVGRRN
jgi:hypothetical protein